MSTPPAAPSNHRVCRTCLANAPTGAHPEALLRRRGAQSAADRTAAARCGPRRCGPGLGWGGLGWGWGEA